MKYCMKLPKQLGYRRSRFLKHWNSLLQVDEDESDSDEEDLKAAKATAKVTSSTPENMETPLDLTEV